MGICGVAVLMFFWCGEENLSLRCCGVLKSYGVRCLCFSRCGVWWNEIICSAVGSCVIGWYGVRSFFLAVLRCCGVQGPLRLPPTGNWRSYCSLLPENKYPILPPSAIHNPLWQSSFFTCKAIRVSISKDVWLTHSPWLLTLTRFHSVGTRLQLLPKSPLTCMVFFGFTLLLSLVNMWCYIVGLLIRISNKKSRETQSGGYFRNLPLLLYFLHSWTQSITKYILLFFIFGIFNWRIYFATTCTKLSF